MTLTSYTYIQQAKLILLFRYEIELEEAELSPLARMNPKFAWTPKERVKRKRMFLSYLRMLGMAGFPFFFIFFTLVFFTIGFELQ